MVTKKMIPLHAKLFLSFISSMRRETMSDVIITLKPSDIRDFINNASTDELEALADAYNDYLEKRARAAFSTRKTITREHIEKLDRYATAAAKAARILLKKNNGGGAE